MSYVRWAADSDVYVYPSYDGIACCMCNLNGGRTFVAVNAVEMLAHLRRHREQGHQVPDRAFPRLEQEAK